MQSNGTRRPCNSTGPHSLPAVRAVSNLAAFYHDRGGETGAEELYTRAAAILEQSLGNTKLADVLRAELRYTESEKLARATLAAMQGAFPEGDPRLVRAQASTAWRRRRS